MYFLVKEGEEERFQVKRPVYFGVPFWRFISIVCIYLSKTKRKKKKRRDSK